MSAARSARSARVAVVGGGISGLTAAYLLRHDYQVTVFERERRLGGQAHSHQVDTPGRPRWVDSGFIVLNDRTYPLLTRLFAELGVATRRTEMSMGISCDGCGLGYVGGRGADGVFAQRRRVGDPRFWRLMFDVRRFQRLARAHLSAEPDSNETYGEFLTRHRFSADFVAHYALPVVACVWSSGQQQATGYPAGHLFRFLLNHGFLSVGDAPQWYVVDGGSRVYVDLLHRRLADAEVLVGTPATAITRKSGGVSVEDASGTRRDFERVVIATHADEALRLLTDPDDAEFEVLGAFGYSKNMVQLHTDKAVLPVRRRERASWSFRLHACDDKTSGVQVSYWMNRLQHHPEEHPLVVTLNGGDRVNPRRVIAETTYTHPIYTPASVAAQRRLPGLNTATTAYAGSYHGWGFHEDGCRAGVAAAAHFGVSW